MRVLVPFWSAVPQDCFYQEFHHGIVEALLELGHEPIPFAFSTKCGLTQAEANEWCRLLEHVNAGAVLDLACWGCAFSGIWVTGDDHQKQSICDRFDLPWVGWLFDHLHSQFIHNVHASRRYAAYSDRDQPDQARIIYPNLKLAGHVTAPPAVRPTNDTSAADWTVGRNIDVLYVGNLEPAALDRFWNDRSHAMWRISHDPDFCNAYADSMLAGPDQPLSKGIQAAIASRGITPLGLHAQFSAVEYFLRYTLRRDAVIGLARSGVRMRIVGQGWDSVALPPNVEMTSPTNYQDFLRLSGRAKICLDASTYTSGANDRVFTYAVNRAVCFTNAAGHLRGTSAEDAGVRFYSLLNMEKLGDDIMSLLAQPSRLRELGEQAKRGVLSGHTWRHRIGDVLATAI
jgi:hypothetical protein